MKSNQKHIKSLRKKLLGGKRKHSKKLILNKHTKVKKTRNKRSKLQNYRSRHGGYKNRRNRYSRKRLRQYGGDDDPPADSDTPPASVEAVAVADTGAEAGTPGSGSIDTTLLASGDTSYMDDGRGEAPIYNGNSFGNSFKDTLSVMKDGMSSLFNATVGTLTGYTMRPRASYINARDSVKINREVPILGAAILLPPPEKVRSSKQNLVHKESDFDTADDTVAGTKGADDVEGKSDDDEEKEKKSKDI
jgi:hypothetical protein